MEKFKSVEQVLDFAIAREVKAYELYTHLARKIKNPGIDKILEDFASEELEHKARLEAAKAGEVKLDMDEVGSLDIADEVEYTGYRPGMTYTEILVMAMKKEKESFKLYTRLAAACNQPEIKEMFLKLAKEEAQHKLRFELEYDLVTF
jgi:rubrerythrin